MVVPFFVSLSSFSRDDDDDTTTVVNPGYVTATAVPTESSGNGSGMTVDITATAGVFSADITTAGNGVGFGTAKLVL